MSDAQEGLQAVHSFTRNASCKTLAVTGESITIPAGAGGTFKDAYISQHPIADANGADIGNAANTSVAVTAGGTTLVTEVDTNTPDSAMTTGQYWINYITGHIRICKGDAGVSATINYSVFVQLSDIKVDDITVSENLTQVGGTNVVTGGVNGSQGVGGLAATNTNAAGNPVLIAGSDYGGTPKAQNLKVDSAGNAQTNLNQVGGNGVVTVANGVQGIGVTDGTHAVAITTAGADGVSNTQNELEVSSRQSSYNGATWDRDKSGVSTVQTAATGMKNTLSMMIYNTAAPAPANTNLVMQQCDSAGNLKDAEQFAAAAEDNTNGVFATAIKPLAASTYSWTLFQNLGANATLNVKASAGSLKSIYCHNVSGAVRYLQIHNTATTPGGGATPALTFLVPISGTLLIDGQWLGENGYYLSTGIAFAVSTTESTYTAATATDHVTQIMYK